MSIREAIRVGFRHFDTAKIYGNEQALGTAIEKKSDPPRKIFLLLRRCGIRITVIKPLRMRLNKPVKS